MTPLEEHHDLALMLLVGRALPDGLPWDMDEDQEFIAQERILWLLLTDEERDQEQRFLSGLWGCRERSRKVPSNPDWGDWAEELGEVHIPDSAFGLQVHNFRPSSKGVVGLIEEYPELKEVLQWLWEGGFQPVDVVGSDLLLIIQPHRIVKEAERLMGRVAIRWPQHRLLVAGRSDQTGVRILASYCPVSGQAFIVLRGYQLFLTG